MSNTPWIAHRAVNPEARLRLFCFHHAGGAAYVFQDWARRLPKTVDVCPVQIPGHATRMDEPLVLEMKTLIDAAVTGMRFELVPPFAFFGHSLGALVAFQLARELRQRHMPGPEHLFVAARIAPSVPLRRGPLHELTDREFLEAVRRRYNAIPDEVAREPDLLALLLPILRADFTLHETYVHRLEPPLACPISAFGGTRDQNVSETDLEAWRLETASRFLVRMIEGDHFFVHAKGSTFMNVLAADLDAITHTLMGLER